MPNWMKQIGITAAEVNTLIDTKLLELPTPNPAYNIARPTFSVKDHDRYNVGLPNFTYTLTPGAAAGTLNISSRVGRLGQSCAFLTLPTAWLNGKHLHCGWYLDLWADPTMPDPGDGQIWFEIRDGSYDRSSNVDFPANNEIALKGAGILQTIATRNTDDGPVYSYPTAEASLASATLPYCTVMFRLLEALADVGATMSLNWFEIRDASDTIALLSEYWTTGKIYHSETGAIAQEFGYIV